MKRIYLSALLALCISPHALAASKDQKIDHKDQLTEDAKNSAKVIITGANKDLRDNIEKTLPKRKPTCNADQEEIENYSRTLKRYLKKAGRGIGYYESEFTIKPSKTANCWNFNVDVQQGAAVKVNTVDIKVIGEGKKEPEFQALLAKPMYKRGDQLEQNKYSDYKSNLAKVANSLGYFDAKFTEHEIRVDLDNKQANIVLHLDTGKRYRFGEVTLEQDILDPKYANRFVQIKKGEPYDSSLLSEQQIYLQTTGYYSDVIIHSRKEKAEDHVIPIEIELTPRKRDAYDIRLGYGTDTGFRTSAKLERRWTGRKGRKLQHEIKLSQYKSSLESLYTVPLHHPKTENVFYSIKLEKEENDDIRSTTGEIGAQYTRKNSGGFQQTAFLKYLKDFTQVEGEDEINSHYVLAGVRADRTKRNNPLFPTEGYRINLDLQGAHDSVLSSQNVFRAEFNAKHLQPLGSGKVVSRLNVGTVVADDFNQLPQSLRFFAGGRDSVRGYDFNSLGELNANGKNIGGKNLFAASLEYDHPINDSFSAATFVDAGNAFQDWGNDNPFKIGAGVGVRWKSPVGPVSVDVAWPKDNFSDPHLHLSIGPEL